MFVVQGMCFFLVCGFGHTLEFLMTCPLPFISNNLLHDGLELGNGRNSGIRIGNCYFGQRSRRLQEFATVQTEFSAQSENFPRPFFHRQFQVNILLHSSST